MTNWNVESIYEDVAKFRLEGCRKRLIAKYPEFLYPLSKIQFVKRTTTNSCTKSKKLSTDGLYIFYSPKKMTRIKVAELELQIMHIILHGILGHFLHQHDFKQSDYRDPLMDAQVAHLMQALGLENQEMHEGILRGEKQLQGDFSMKQYYRAIREPKFGTKLYHIWRYLSVDNHREWDYKERQQRAVQILDTVFQNHQKELQRFWKEARSYLMENDDDDTSYASVKRKIQQCSAKQSQMYGSVAGTEAENIHINPKPVHNYHELLQELFSIKETVKEQPDSIDPMFYHYGLDLYHDVPLIEPLEYAEVRTPGLIVIAVDVSGSCCDQDTMEQFWSETYGCISQLKDSYEEGAFLILQCDTKIQKEEWLHLSDFEQAPKHIQSLGFGGTSFVPVFERIQTLIQDGKKIEALLYLTDGDGDYPDKPIDIPAYFIMPTTHYQYHKEHADIPNWITPIELEENI